MEPDSDKCLIKKEVVHTGKIYKPLRDGCKVHFHFQTRKIDPDKTLVDDSRKIGNKQPMVLVLGKKFKLEAWEAMVQKMAVEEVAKFTVDKSLVVQYPFVAKTLRDLSKNPCDRRNHICGVALQNDGIGYKDLNELISKPCDLEFMIELLKVEFPEEYEKDSWQLTDEERLNNIPILKEKGNDYFRNKNYAQAADAYSEAIGLCEQLMIKEKPHDEYWKKLDVLKIPLLLNFSQCKLVEGDYYAVIEHCTTVLKSDPDNVKALFRRGKANVSAWRPSDALADFNRVKELDTSLSTAVAREVKELEELQRNKDGEDKIKLKNMFS